MIDSSDFAFDKADSPVEKRLAQIERDVFNMVISEGESDQRWIKKEFATARHERYVVGASELFRQRLGRDYSAKAASYN